MKKVLKLSLIATCLIGLTSCGDELDKYRRNGQLVELDYTGLNEKIVSDDSFVFYLSSTGCPGCKAFYPEVKAFLQENENVTIYTLNKSDMQEVDKFTLAAYYVDALGTNYFEKEGISSMALYTPSICKVVDGEFVYAQIRNLDKETIGKLYQENYLSFDSYYMYNRRVQKKEKFNIFISKNGDNQYDDSLREYFINNPSFRGYYLNTSNFDDYDNERLLNRINYYLGEGNEIEQLPEYCLLQYENGSLVNYVDSKYDVNLLDALFNKN